MNIASALILATSAMLLTAPAFSATSAGAPIVRQSDDTFAAIPSHIVSWQQMMHTHATVLFASLRKEAGSEAERNALRDEEAQLATMIDNVAYAATELFLARQAYFHAAFKRMGKASQGLNRQGFDIQREIWQSDMASLARNSMWLPDEVRGEEGGAGAFRMPAIVQDVGALKPGDPPPVQDYRLTLQVQLWERLLQETANLIAGCYKPEFESGKALVPMMEPCTRLPWEGDEAARAEMGKLFERCETAWADYRQAILQLICPLPRFSGTGFSMNNSTVNATLLEGRDAFLGSIARGFTPDK